MKDGSTGTFNVVTLMGETQELAEMMKRKNKSFVFKRSNEKNFRSKQD